MERREVLAGIGGLALSGIVSSAEVVTNKASSGSNRTLLRIDGSSRVKDSYSRQLADTVEAGWRKKYPDGTVIKRDLGQQPVPHVPTQAIQGFYDSPDRWDDATRRAMTPSETLVRELKSANDLLLSVPMYNFTVPSAIKAWIDQIVRPGWAFEYTADGQIKGLLGDKSAYVAMAYGFEYSGTPLASHDFLKPYLQSIFAYIGLSNTKFVAVEGTAAGDAVRLENNMRNALAAASRLVA